MADPRINITAVDKTKAAIDSAQRNLRSLGDTAASLPARFGTLGVAIAAAFSAVTVKGAIDTLDQLDDLSEKTGIAVESLSALRYAGEVTGTPLEAIATSTKFLAKNMSEAAAGNKEATSTFKTLGVEVKDASGALRAQDAVLLDLADVFKSFPDGPEKSAAAVRIFGKSGQDMIPLLNQGSDGIRRLRGEAEGLGVVYGGDLAKQAATFNDNLKKLELNAEAAKVAIAGGLLGSINQLIEAFVKLKQEGLLWVAIKDSIKGAVGLGTLTGDNGADIAALNAERQRLEKRRKFAESRGLATRDIDSDIFNNRELSELAKLRQREQALGMLGADAGGDAQSRRLGIGKMRTPRKFKDAAGAGKDADADFKAYLGNLQQQVQKTQELTVYEKLLDDIRRGALTVDAKQRERLELLAKEVDAQKDALQIAQERQKLRNKDYEDSAKAAREIEDAERERLQRLLQGGPAAQLEAQRREMQFLAGRVATSDAAGNVPAGNVPAGMITPDQFSDAATGFLKLQGDIKDTKDVAADFATSFSSRFEEAILSGRKLGDVIKGLGQDILQIGLRSAVTQPLGKAAGGWLTSLLSFDGGGYTGDRPRSGGLDGKGGFMAMLHPQEDVIDRTRGGTSAARSMSVTVKVDATGTRVQGDGGQANQLGNLVGTAVRQILLEEQRPGGLLASE